MNFPATLKLVLAGQSMTLGRTFGCKVNVFALRFGISVVSEQALAQLE